MPSPHLRNALEATLIFAQYEAGTAVCVDPAGWVLTCAHCFGDTEAEYEASSKRRWLLFYTGLAVQVECRAWDLTRDLALLKIIAVEADAVPEAFPFLAPATTPPIPGVRIVCIGQPGQDDLESTSARRTKYHLVEISEGAFRGMVPGADPQDNAEIGTLKHDAWTYWGHSGAPLVGKADGRLVGLHSSWDDQTAMRHGVPHAAISAFLEIHLGV
ncbi:trypsin-like cysteine/serine peptidase domain-containing protein [Mycena filopes]|nr:trypsin-like cysteine/serine peptidase domain-containing protein [Mycena filopes]